MILKSYELEKKNITQYKIFLFYGQNEGLKKQVIEEKFYSNFDGEIIKIEEAEIVKNQIEFFSSLMNRSFFEKRKLIIISRVTDKILNFIKEIYLKNISDIIIVLNSPNLEKKSKLRNFFEKEKNIICSAFYLEEFRSLLIYANKILNEHSIKLSNEIINMIIERCRGDRQNLNNEINKIINFSCNRKNKLTFENIEKLTNLAENYTISELVDSCLNKNLKKTIRIINENNFSYEDNLIIIRMILSKVKRLINLSLEYNKNKNIDLTISSYKPPIFWKDKIIVKNQILTGSEKEFKKIIYKINEIELQIKKNFNNSSNIIQDYLLNIAKKVNN